MSEREVIHRYHRFDDDPSLATAHVPPFKPTGNSQTDKIVHEMTRMLRYPEKSPGLFANLRLRPIRGMILSGPPGSGKTSIARAVRDECSRSNNRKVAFFEAKLGVMLDGNPNNNIHKLFDAGAKLSPSFIFLDEIDVLLSDTKRHARMDRTLQCLLDGLSDRGAVYVLVATNFPTCIGDALRRPGRLELMFEMRLPDFDERKQLLAAITEGWTIARHHFKMIANVTNGFSPADLSAACRRAALIAFERLNPALANPDASNWGPLDEGIDITSKDLDDGVEDIRSKHFKYMLKYGRQKDNHLRQRNSFMGKMFSQLQNA